ncbi:MAG TPA: hypothetical protein VGR14_19395 [Verrucomicrobiae bacterium]|jgi:hypothetical protein|nr:hypothetical protein [Verrucomicrobiae bacterium]
MKARNAKHNRHQDNPGPPDLRLGGSPALADMLKAMKSALANRKRKTTWITDAIRVELFDRYATFLAEPEKFDLNGLIEWVTKNGRYLAASGNFAMFCTDYFASTENEARALWAEASPPA